jgi:hypothetical protein
MPGFNKLYESRKAFFGRHGHISKMVCIGFRGFLVRTQIMSWIKQDGGDLF